MSSTMTVRQMQIRAKSHGLTGYSRMRKAELVALLDSIRHNVGDIVERAIDRKRGVVVEIQNSTFDGVDDSTVIVQYDGEKREDATCGAHHAFVFISGPVDSLESRAGGKAITMHPNKPGHGYITLENGNAQCVAKHVWLADANQCAFDAMWANAVNANKAIEALDAIDHGHAVEVMTQVVGNGREDLTDILDTIDASAFQSPDVKSSIPCVPGCEKCEGDANRCDACMLAWLVDLYKITGDVKLNELPAVPEFDCV